MYLSQCLINGFSDLNDNFTRILFNVRVNLVPVGELTIYSDLLNISSDDARDIHGANGYKKICYCREGSFPIRWYVDKS